MTPKQQALYFRAWGECRKALAALGRDASDAARHALQAEALDGKKKSSTALTNGELDRVLAKFRSYSEPGNLDAQLKPEDDANARRLAALHRCYRVCNAFVPGEGSDVSLRRRGWLDRASRNRHGGANFDDLDTDQLIQLAFTLEARVRAKHKADAEADLADAIARGEAADRENPF